MYALDFEYDGHYLSDYGFIICDFDGSTGVQTASAGSNLTFNVASRRSGKKYGLIGTKYEERIQSVFHICKDPEKYDDMRISNADYRDLMRWLNRREFLKFKVIYPHKDDPSKVDCYFNASFNVGKITIGEILYGLELTMETDSPFGYGEEIVYYNVTDYYGSEHIVHDMSDEIGTSYISMTITCSSAGNLVIKNTTTDCTTIVNNCKAGEIISIDGDALTIASSDPLHKICRDFNFVFPTISNTFTQRENRIAVSLPCTLEIRYAPIIKDIP